MLQGWCMAKVLIKPKYFVRKKIFFVSNTLKIFSTKKACLAKLQIVTCQYHIVNTKFRCAVEP